MAEQTSDVFISYSRKDIDFCERLQAALATDGRRPWVDTKDIPLTSQWLAEIEAAIEAAHTVVFVLSPDSLASEICLAEARHAARHNKRMIPIVCRPLETVAVPSPLRDYQWLDFCHGDFDVAYRALTAAIDTDLEHVRTHTRLLVRAREWEKRGRRRDALLRGHELREAEQWLAANGREPRATALHALYLSTSRTAAGHRMKAAAVGAVAGVALAVAAMLFWRDSALQERVATSRRLAAQASNLLPGDLDLALLLAIAATDQSPTFEAREGLLRAVSTSPELAGFLDGHRGEVSRIAFHPDGRRLVSAARDGRLFLWDLESRRPARAPLVAPGAIAGLALDRAGERMVTGGVDGAVLLWNLRDEPPRFREVARLQAGVASVTLSRDGALLAAGTTDGRIVLWDLREPGAPPGVLSGHRGVVSSVAFVEGDRRLLSGSADSTLAVWDVATRSRLATMDGTRHGSIWDVAMSADEKTVASAHDDGTVALWDLRPAVPEPVRLARLNGGVSSVAFAPAGNAVAYGGADGASLLHPLGGGSPRPLRAFRAHASTIAFDPRGRFLAVGTSSGKLALWDMAAGPRLATALAAPAHDVMSLAFAPDGATVAAGHRGGHLILWDLAVRPPRQRPLAGHTGNVLSLAFHRDGGVLVSGGSDAAILVWDVARGSLRHRLPTEPQSIVRSLSFNGDGTLLVSAGSGHAPALWDPRREFRRVGNLSRETRAVSVAFGPAGRTVAVGDRDGGLTLRDAGSGAPVTAVQKAHGSVVQSLALAPDARVLVSGGLDHSLVVWDIGSGPSLRLRAQVRAAGPVAALGFGLDSGLVASAGEGAGLLLWDVSGSSPRAMAPGPGDAFRDLATLAVSPDGKRIVAGGDRGRLFLWSVDPADWRERACRVAGRNLTCPEWKEYLPGDAHRQLCPEFPHERCGAGSGGSAATAPLLTHGP